MVDLVGFNIYLDANTIIYALEGLSEFPNLKAALIDPLDAGEITVVTSHLSLLEAVVHPRRNSDTDGEEKIRTF